MSEILKRLLVALIGIPLVVVLVISGGFFLKVILVFASARTLWEYYRIAESKGSSTLKIPGIVAGTLLQLLLFEIFEGKINALIFFPMAIALITLMFLSLELWLNKSGALINTSSGIMGIVYINVLLAFIYGVRHIDGFAKLYYSAADYSQHFTSSIDDYSRAWLLLSIFASIWLCDSSAYFTGKAIGKHKLFPRVSPKKTWEGAIGGFAGAILGFWLISELSIGNFPLIHAIIIGAIIGVVAQTGDLAESQLKRDAGVKDSSNILPGHGGVLDRLDSILFVLPVVFIYLLFFV